MLIVSSWIERAKLRRLCPGSVREAEVISAAQAKGTEPGDIQADLFLKLATGTEAQQVTGRHTFYTEKGSWESISFRFGLPRVEKISEHHQASGLSIFTDSLLVIFRSFPKLFVTNLMEQKGEIDSNRT